MSSPPPQDPYAATSSEGGPLPQRRFEPPPPGDPAVPDGSRGESAPPRPARQRGGFGRGFGLGLGFSLGAGVVAVLLGGLVAAAVAVALVAGVAGLAGASSGTQGGRAVTETVWGEDDATGRLLAVPVTGTILGGQSDGATFGAATYGYEVARSIDELDADDADGLVLEMNTPGGTIHGSRAIADAVARYQDRTGHPVMAFVQGLSASGGMYAMAGVDEIVLDHGSLVGSIGIVSGPFSRYRDVTGIPGSLLDPGVTTEGGITQEYLSRGTGKDFGNPYRDMTEEERAVWGTMLDNEYGNFVDWVSQARGIPAETIVGELGAHLYDGQSAVDNGLADAVMGSDEAYRRGAELARVDPSDTRVDRLLGPSALESFLGLEALGGAVGSARSATPEPGRSVVCAGGPVVLAYHGDLATACSAG